MTETLLEASSPESSTRYQFLPDATLHKAQAPATQAVYRVNTDEAPATALYGRSANQLALLRRIASFANLPADWDGYGGQAASGRAVADARTFIRQMPLQSALPKASIAGCGEITLYWDNGTHYLEASFPGDGTYHYFADEGAEPVDAEDNLLIINSPSDRLRRCLMRFFA